MSKGHFSLLLFAFCLLPCCFLSAQTPAAQHYQAGLAYERLGRLEDAYTELQVAFALDPDHVELATALGVVAVRLSRPEVALRALERAVAIDANSVGSYYQLAFLYEKLRRPDRAVDAWSRFLLLSQDEALKAVAKKHLAFLSAHGS